MPVLIVLIVIGLLLWAQRVIYQHFWSKKLTAQVKIRDSYMFEGNETEITEIMTNDKILPLPWVHLKFQIFRNGKTAEIFRSDVFNILFHQQIIRKSKLELKRRGVYQISKLDLLSYDMFITKKFVKMMDNQAQITVYPATVEKEVFDVPYEKIMGNMATKRYTIEDPFLFKGIRDYQEHDSFKDINFMASAKAGKWLVNTHEFTLDQTVRLILLTDNATNYYDENLYESGLRLAAAMLSRFERDGVPCSFMCNGLDSLDKKELVIEAGCSENHIDTVLENMARLELDARGSRGSDIVDALQEKRQAEDYYVIIAPYYGKDLVEAYNNLHSYTTSCTWICPISAFGFDQLEQYIQDMDKTIEDFHFYKV
ncbi:MAG: DUF58 domain-containing protein [Firmicutes bacterium]|nr:DUF58 domain-containing protein [Bacillota bacterium]